MPTNEKSVAGDKAAFLATRLMVQGCVQRFSVNAYMYNRSLFGIQLHDSCNAYIQQQWPHFRVVKSFAIVDVIHALFKNGSDNSASPVIRHCYMYNV